MYMNVFMDWVNSSPPTKYTYGEGINMNNLPFAHKKKKKNWKDYHVYIDNYFNRGCEPVSARNTRGHQ